MNAHEHIWVLMADCAKRGLTKEQALEQVRKNAAYAILPDRIRSAVSPVNGKGEVLGGYRPVTHFTEDAWMTFPHGEALKNFRGLSDTDYFIPPDAKNSAFGSPPIVKSFVHHNKEFLKYPQSSFTFAHILQDVVTDETLGTVTMKQHDTENDMLVYGHKVSDGNCVFDKTGKDATLADFRSFVTLAATLTSSKLWRNLKASYPDLTVDEVTQVTIEACQRDYGGRMAETSTAGYVAPSDAQRAFLEVDSLERPVEISGYSVQSIGDINNTLVVIGAFHNTAEIVDCTDRFVEGALNAQQSVRNHYEKKANKKTTLNLSNNNKNAGKSN